MNKGTAKSGGRTMPRLTIKEAHLKKIELIYPDHKTSAKALKTLQKNNGNEHSRRGGAKKTGTN